MDDPLKTTTKPEEIKLWAQAHDASPEIVDTGNGETLRLNFPGPEDDISLGETVQEQPVKWNEFFTKIDLSDEYKFRKSKEIPP